MPIFFLLVKMKKNDGDVVVTAYFLPVFIIEFLRTADFDVYSQLRDVEVRCPYSRAFTFIIKKDGKFKSPRKT